MKDIWYIFLILIVHILRQSNVVDCVAPTMLSLHVSCGCHQRKSKSETRISSGHICVTLQTTQRYCGPEGTSPHMFSIAWTYFALCEKTIRDYVYKFILHEYIIILCRHASMHNHLEWKHKYLACIHDYIAYINISCMYTHLSMHLYIIISYVYINVLLVCILFLHVYYLSLYIYIIIMHVDIIILHVHIIILDVYIIILHVNIIIIYV